MSYSVTRIAEYRQGEANFIRVQPARAPGKTLHYRLPGGLYQALEGLTASSDRLLSHILAQAEPVTAPPSDASLQFLPPCLPPHASLGMVSGFGLTHRNKVAPQQLNEQGITAGHPAWFFKGFANSLKLDGEPLRLSANVHQVCEEAEIVLIFRIDDAGEPLYLGFSFGNDITDIGQIRAHPGHLSWGKLADSAIVPELLLGELPGWVDETVTVQRDGETLWQAQRSNGGDTLAYPLTRLLAKLWSNPTLRVPGMMHYLYLGADRNSSEDGCTLRDGDRITLRFEPFGIQLSNPVLTGVAL